MFHFERQANEVAQKLQNKHSNPARGRGEVVGAAQQIGDEDGLQQAGDHQSQAEREEDVWQEERKGHDLYMAFVFTLKDNSEKCM